MPDFLGKRYKLYSSENFDDFMKALDKLKEYE
ncbi:fatty acid binding protein [Apis cerana cerana]|uniref:Fatty acid binding protein n=1 Tax=Apis cerana cerana TaxID=94128 RepID=A0A2A3ETC6_APICC|nr:fatty acid binding protein [Apis cerana cerana]